MSSRGSVLILDAMQRSALAATRSLGRQGLQVTCADECTSTLAGASRYCIRSLVYPSPRTHAAEFLDWLRGLARSGAYSAVLPMTEVSTRLLLDNRDSIPGIAIPFRNPAAFHLLSDKAQLAELAEDIEVRVPRTRLVTDAASIRDVATEVGYPLVLKLSQSSNYPTDGSARQTVYYAKNEEELLSTLDANTFLRQWPLLIQQYIRGTGAGVFALYDMGRPVVFFAHRRLREKPPSGGISVLSESAPLNEELMTSARRLLDHVGWDGVAMVEFKIAEDGTAYLMEVNARFWGSLQLAIDAGVDFPYLQYLSAMGQAPVHDGKYTIGTRSRWLLGDLDHLYLRMKTPGKRYPGLPSLAGAVVQFLNPLPRNTRYEVNRCDDIEPFVFELKRYFS